MTRDTQGRGWTRGGGLPFARGLVALALVLGCSTTATPSASGEGGGPAEGVDEGEEHAPAILEAFFRLDEAFHARLLEAGKHPAVWPIVAQAKSQMDRARRLSLPAGGKMSDLIAQHSAVVDALEQRNVGGAVQALRHHLRVVLADIAQMRTENPGLFE